MASSVTGHETATHMAKNKEMAMLDFIMNVIYGAKNAKIADLQQKLEESKSEAKTLKEQSTNLFQAIEQERKVRQAVIAYYQGESLEIWDVEGLDECVDDGEIRQFSGVVAAKSEDEAIHLVANPQSTLVIREVSITKATRHYLENVALERVYHRTLMPGQTWKQVTA